MLVANITALKGVDPSTATEVTVEGYTSSHDGGGGVFFWSTASPIKAEDKGTVFASTVSGYTTNGRWYRIYSGSLDVRWFGATGSGMTDDTPAFQRAIDVASASPLMATVFVPDVGNSYLLKTPVILNNFVRIKSNGASVSTNQITANKSFFVLDTNVAIDTDIEIDGLNTKGLNTKVDVIRGDIATTAKKVIKRVALKNITSEFQVISIDFNATYVELSNITLGLGLKATDARSSVIYVPHDSAFTSGLSFNMNNCYVWSGNADQDMYFIKAGSYKDVRMTNLTAHRLILIDPSTGDGFDMDGLGENVVLDNIRSINCGIEIKPGSVDTYGVGTKNLTASNITALSGGISIRASGNYSNITSIDSPITALVMADTDADNDERFINVSNVLLVKVRDNDSAFLTIAKNNVNITNLSITKDPLSTSTEIAQAIRVSACRNVTLSNIHIKNAKAAFFFPTDAIVKNLVVNACTFTKISSGCVSFGNISNLINLTFNDLIFDNPGSFPPPVNLITFGSGTFTNVKFNNCDNAFIKPLFSYNSFNPYSENFLFNNVMYDKLLSAGSAPVAANIDLPVGHFVLNVADGTLYFRKSITAYGKVTLT